MTHDDAHESGAYEQLSSAGCARREAMLDDLRAEVVTRGAQRRRARARNRAIGVSSLGLVIIAAAVVALTVRTPAPGPGAPINEPRAHNDPLPTDEAAPPRPTHQRSQVLILQLVIDPDRTPIRIVQVEPGVARRFSTATRARSGALPQILYLNDAELLTTLAAAGRPTGLVRSEGRVWLTASVTDAALEKEHESPNNKTDEELG